MQHVIVPTSYRADALLRIAHTQLSRLAADGDEASAKALWKYVEREMGR